MTRLAPGQLARPSTYDPQTRSVTAVMATTFPVPRRDFVEILAIRPESVDLSRIAQRAVKLLNSHQAGDIANVLGSVTEAWIEGGELFGRIVFAESDAGRIAERDVAAGLLTSLSVGYSIHSARLLQKRDEDELDRYEVTRWTLLEVSLVAVPADPSAAFRSMPPVRTLGGRSAAFVPLTREAVDVELVDLRLALLAAEERADALDEAWFDGRNGRAPQPTPEEMDTAEARVDGLKKAIARAEKRAAFLRAAPAPSRR
jgi:HK97 family phage prohead protease